MKKLDLTGVTFGKWTALRPASKLAHWTCQCACKAVVDVFIGSLRSGRSEQCSACQSRWMSSSGQASRNSTKHGMYKSSEYNSWTQMRARCLNPKNHNFPNYGGRGITVCDRWKDSFENFFTDMGPKPTRKHTIDRIDNNGNYGPQNVRWATIKQQNRNKRTSRWITYKGMKIRLIDAAALVGVVSYGAAKARINRGWDVERALTLPIQK